MSYPRSCQSFKWYTSIRQELPRMCLIWTNTVQPAQALTSTEEPRALRIKVFFLRLNHHQISSGISSRPNSKILITTVLLLISLLMVQAMVSSHLAILRRTGRNMAPIGIIAPRMPNEWPLRRRPIISWRPIDQLHKMRRTRMITIQV